MDRETVRQGDFRPDPSKVIFEGILLLLIINYTGRIFQKNSNNAHKLRLEQNRNFRYFCKIETSGF
jgi:hypothetical protein